MISGLRNRVASMVCWHLHIFQPEICSSFSFISDFWFREIWNRFLLFQPYGGSTLFIFNIHTAGVWLSLVHAAGSVFRQNSARWEWFLFTCMDCMGYTKEIMHCSFFGLSQNKVWTKRNLWCHGVTFLFLAHARFRESMTTKYLTFFI